MEDKKKGISNNFTRIANRYDLINRFMSFGFDLYWRNRFIKTIDIQGQKKSLDLACGTGDIAIQMARKYANLQITGVDLSEGMLEIAKKKVKNLNLSERIRLVRGDILNLSFDSSSFDIATMVFGLRNLPDINLGFSEISRVINQGGSIHIMEFSIPEKEWIRIPYQFYLRYIIPAIGTVLSGDYDMFRYFVNSIETFPSSDSICDTMNIHFTRVNRPMPIFGGIVSIYTATN